MQDTPTEMSAGRKLPPPPPSRSLKVSVIMSEEERRKREEKNRVKRATAAKELYETEVTYVRSIMILTNVLPSSLHSAQRTRTRTAGVAN
jgi:hypothetical protein